MTMSISAACLPRAAPKVVPGLRLRPVPELERCLVYRPRPPALLMLNLGAWLLLEILTEEPGRDPWPSFRDCVRHTCPEAKARALMNDGLQQLAKLDLIELGAMEPRES
jgi:hypothetical protein